MSNLNSSEINMYTRQLQQQFGQSSIINVEGVSCSYDDIAWFYNAVSKDATPAEKQQARENILKQALKNILKGVFNSQKAKEDIKTSGDNIKSGEKDGKDIKISTGNDIESILGVIDGDMASIDAALNKINEIGGPQFEAIQAKLEAKKTEIEEQISIIEEAQEKGDVKQITESLMNIGKIQGEIESILSDFDNLTAAIENETTNVNNLSEHIVEQQGSAEEKLKEGLEEIEGVTVETTKEGTYNVNYIQQGGLEAEKAVELEAAAATTEVGTFGTGTAAAAELQKKAVDLASASKTHIGGGAKNLTALGSALGNLGGDMKDVSSYATTIGNKLSAAESIIGSYTTSASGYITAVGSYKETLTDANDVLKSNVEQDQATISKMSKDGGAADIMAMPLNQDISVVRVNNQLQFGENDDKEAKNPLDIELLTPNTDLSAFSFKKQK